MAASLDNDNDDGVISAINITPFVDVVLVLLVIFMVTSTAIIKASLKVDLPKAKSAGETVESTLNIVLTKDNVLFLDGTQVTFEDLQQRIVHEQSKNPTVRAVIAADKNIAYGEVIRIIDFIKAHGVTSFALNIEKQG
jgi:biopolymer transport protein ExbD